MKKVVVLFFTLVVAFALTSCFKSDQLEENKIMAPTSKPLDIDGTWEVTAQYTIGEDSQLKKIQDIQKPMITISRDVAIAGDLEIDNPKFKFKRVIKKNYLPPAFDSVVNGVPLDDGFMNIITISNNTNLYLDFILKNNNEGYIYAVGDLLQVKRISTNLDENEIKAANDKTSKEYAYKKKMQDTGVLIGLKEPATLGSDGKIKNAVYKTVWISMINGKLQEPIFLNGLLLPRINGGFSEINMVNSYQDKKPVNILTVSSENKNGKSIVQSSVVPNTIRREITFVGKDYIGLEYYNNNNFNSSFDDYRIIPVDSIDSNKSLDMVSLFGTKGQNAYINSREKFIASKSSSVLEQYNLQEQNMSDITMFRKNARWVLDGMLNSKTLGVSDLPFDIDISPVGTLVNYDSLPVSWNKLKEIEPNANDAFSSPNGNFIVIMNDNSLKVYDLSNGDIDEKPLMTIPIDKGDISVMAEWATGDFISLWNKAVEQRKK